MDDELEELHKKRLRKIKIRMIAAIVIGVAALGAGIYMKFVRSKSQLGGPCRFAMDCEPASPACMRGTPDGEGVCSRTCDAGADCADGVHCVSIETGERDERGMPIHAGYCFPQSFIDMKKSQRHDAGAHR